MREYFFQNFLEVFTEDENMPPSILLPRLIDCIQKNGKEPVIKGDKEHIYSYRLNSIDFQFFNAICKHPNLMVVNVVRMIDLMFRVYLNDILFA